LSNEDIFNSIVKKENGVNPFLTVMNFKISFKTWMKFARKGLRIDKSGKKDEPGTFNKALYEQDDQPAKLIPVDIEVEELYEVTSEEELPETSVYSIGRRKSIAAGLGQLSPTGSQGEMGVSSIGSYRKKKDHLKMFEKKMSQKLKWNQILSGTKTGKDMANVSSNAGSSQKGSSDWRKTQFGMALQKTKTLNAMAKKDNGFLKSPTKRLSKGGNSNSNPNL